MELLLIVLEFAAEFFLEFLAEGLIDVGSRASNGDRKPPHPFVMGLIYCSLSIVLGVASLQLFPHHFIRDPEMRIWNVILTPIVLAIVMGEWGGYLRRSGKRVVALDSYALGYSFALIFALIRYQYAG